MIRAVLFDFDETISNRQLSVYRCYKQFLKKYLKYDENDIEFEAILQEMMLYDKHGNGSVESRVDFLIEKYGVDRCVIEDYYDFWVYHSHEFLVVEKETIEILDELKKKYKLGLVTNGVSHLQNNKIDCSGVRDRFDACIVGGDFKVSKPDPQIFHYICEQLDVKPEECVYVGDIFHTDILGAVRANITPIWLWSDYKTHTDYPLIRITHLRELPEVLEKLNS